ncbi:YicC/YloC family endoribonuclease [Candidatus Magnetaquicoccus inordinatus]|uniref:YicC/YloC family endoribonuclease n=1 Tax=Candidatus Magnetaquicoccus inordinatus TaxID=2496818 RepID=UPI00102CF509|nr:YicC/YloC family endoribonuclease [Candidatus Magnetaquicoccus inordinatus]
MPSSMTGFSEQTGSVAGFRLVWRLRSVNHRYLDIAFRRPGNWPGNWHDLESQATKRLQSRFARGHLDCELTLHNELESGHRLELDQALLYDLRHVAAELKTALGPEGVEGQVSLDRLLSWPGLVRERSLQESDGSELSATALELLEMAAEQLELARIREGEALTHVIRQLLDEFATLLSRLEGLLPALRQEQKRLLVARVNELTGTAVDAGELAREVAILLNRMEIAEEVERLRMHLRELHNLMAGTAPVGRKLDFFCQELNREANTVCSKSQNSALTRLGVEMKLVIEKLREQAQNLE